jgi:hypothetical protein
MRNIYSKVNRANRHIEELHRSIRRFIDTSPYKIGRKLDPRTGEAVYYLTEAPAVPDEMALIAGDVLQNLRSTLDHLAWALVETNGGKPTPGVTGFPIMEREPLTTKEKASFDRKIEGMGQEAKDVIRRLRPYKGGDDDLWLLHRLNNIDKHRTIFTVGFAVRSIATPYQRIAASPTFRTGPLENGGELFRENSQISNKVDFMFDVAINEPELIACEPLIFRLRMSYNKVFRLIGEFDLCWRL